MKFTRRQFIKGTLVTGAYVAVGGVGALWKPRSAYAFSQSPKLAKFIQPLRGIGGTGIPVAASDGTRIWGSTAATHYTMNIGQFTDQLHPSLANPTKLWGYNPSNSATQRHLGGIIAARKGTPVQITFQNNLPNSHILPVDVSANFPDAALAVNRTAVHLHGGLVPWISDGGPYDWFDPNGNVGPSFVNNQVLLGSNGVPGQAEYYYPNNQSARLLWYHDHNHDTTRLNAYAGVASAYVITDSYEDQLVLANNLPDPLDTPNINPAGRTIYLVFQDKIFFTGTNDSSYPVTGAQSGDLWYAHDYDPNRWTTGPGFPPPVGPSVIPEFFGDTMLCNGTVFPFLEVKRQQYRFRVLNACNARFLRPRLVYAQSNTIGTTASTEPNTSKLGPNFIQIGTEGGFLPAPVPVNGSSQLRLTMAPAERGDFIVDFSNVPDNSVLLLYTDAPAPFPAGDALNDYSPTNFQTPSARQGFGPNTRTLLQIRVKGSAAANSQISLPSIFTPTDPFRVAQTPGVPLPDLQGRVPLTAFAGGGFTTPPVRHLTLNEDFDQYGRLIQLIGTDTKLFPLAPTFGRGYLDAPTEVVNAGTEEIWEIMNLTGDTHPMHFHLVNVQVLSRQPFDAANFNGVPAYTGPAVAPDNNELGWKETVRMYPGQVTRVYMKFDLDLADIPFPVPSSPRAIAILGTNPPTGKNFHEFVWHCHILEHEEHDMMRPLIVVG